MDKFYKLIIKKLFDNTFRLVLMTISFSIGIFLFLFVMTIGINTVQNHFATIENMGFLRQIQIEANQFEYDNIRALHRHGSVLNLQVETQSNLVLSSIKSQIALTEVYITSVDKEFDIVLDSLLYGKALDAEHDIMIGVRTLRAQGIEWQSVLNEAVILTDGVDFFERTVVGVFDDSAEGSFMPFAIIQNTSYAAPINRLLAQVNDINSVANVDSFVRQLGMIPTSRSAQITQINNVGRLIVVGFAFVGILLFLTSVVILHTTLKVSVKSKYRLIAMLRVQGYRNSKLRLIVFVELAVVAVLSYALSFVLYILSLVLLPDFVGVSFLGVQLIDVFGFSTMATLVTFAFSVVGLAVVAIRPIMMLHNCDVVGLLREGEQ